MRRFHIKRGRRAHREDTSILPDLGQKPARSRKTMGPGRHRSDAAQQGKKLPGTEQKNKICRNQKKAVQN